MGLFGREGEVEKGVIFWDRRDWWHYCTVQDLYKSDTKR